MYFIRAGLILKCVPLHRPRLTLPLQTSLPLPLPLILSPLSPQSYNNLLINRIVTLCVEYGVGTEGGGETVK